MARSGLKRVVKTAKGGVRRAYYVKSNPQPLQNLRAYKAKGGTSAASRGAKIGAFAGAVVGGTLGTFGGVVAGGSVVYGAHRSSIGGSPGHLSAGLSGTYFAPSSYRGHSGRATANPLLELYTARPARFAADYAGAAGRGALLGGGLGAAGGAAGGAAFGALVGRVLDRRRARAGSRRG